MDLKGKSPGRGAYVCRQETCLQRAIKSKALERAFSTAIPQEVYDRLTEEMEAAEDA